MSTLSLSPPSSFDPEPGLTLTAELIDAVADAIVTRRDPLRRAAVISELIEEVRATLQWRGDCDAASDEIGSFTEVSAAARAHHERMATSADRPPTLTP